MRKRVKHKVGQQLVVQEWARVRRRMTQTLAISSPSQSLELLDLCRIDPALKQWRPSLSMGRLCLARPARYARFYSFEFPCLYFAEGHYTVADHGNYKKWPFTTAEAAIAFARQHLFTVPRSPEYEVLLSQEAILVSFQLEWFTSRAVLELQSSAGRSLVALSGVTGCEATNFNILAEQGYAVLSLEYDNESLRMYLKNGDYIRIMAKAMDIRSV
jgi:hypothetical protein